ncbi:MAG: 50S ribosomal protein L29 [Bacilli bacterium]|nr:50S ribosomal protein L29 [Bacilli bacterium]
MAAKKQSKKVVKNLSQVNQIRELENQEIEARILELKKELHNLRFQAAVGKLEKTAQLKKVKKEIARAYTVLTERANANN